MKIVHDTHCQKSSIPNASGSHQTEVKIAYIGGGSREWAVKLLGDLALSSRLRGLISLYDIDCEAAAYNKALSEVIFAHPQAQTFFQVKVERQLQDALRGADVVVISIEPGSIQMRHADLEIPAKYGVLQTVGDTTGPGGILRALRSVPIYEHFAAAIMEYCPEAWVINYTNPMGVCTAALYAAAPSIKAFGCCHEVFGTQKMLARLVDSWFGAKETPREEIELDIAGVNHFTWATSVRWKGKDLMPRLREMVGTDVFFENRSKDAETAVAKQKWFDHSELVAYDLLRRFGALGAAGDRHLAEFVPWYLLSERELHRWGVILTPYSWRVQRLQEPRPALDGCAKKELKPSGEEGVKQIEALLGLHPLLTNVNLPNKGQLRGFPEGVIVETYAQFRQDAISPMVAGNLPLGAATWVLRAMSEQTLTLKAALERDPHIAFQSLLTHPLVRIPTDTAWKMFQEMLTATRDMLPGWGI